MAQGVESFEVRAGQPIDVLVLMEDGRKIAIQLAISVFSVVIEEAVDEDGLPKFGLNFAISTMKREVKA